MTVGQPKIPLIAILSSLCTRICRILFFLNKDAKKIARRASNSRRSAHKKRLRLRAEVDHLRQVQMGFRQQTGRESRIQDCTEQMILSPLEPGVSFNDRL